MYDLSIFKFDSSVLQYDTKTGDVKQLDEGFPTEIPWKAASKTNSTVRTHKLFRSDEGRLEFRRTTGMKVFSFLFIIFGICFLYFGIIDVLISNGFKFSEVNPWMILASLLPIFAGAMFLNSTGKALVFDKAYGYFWSGKFDPNFPKNFKSSSMKLGEVEGLQIIEKYVSKSKYIDSNYCYELNLVAKDKSRRNVVIFGDPKHILEDGIKIAEFLRVPIWTRKVN
jgi:hypothetical protein